MLRKELTELREIVTQVRDGVLAAGDARSALNEMAMRQNDWTLGAFCSRYCNAVALDLLTDALLSHLSSIWSSHSPGTVSTTARSELSLVLTPYEVSN